MKITYDEFPGYTTYQTTRAKTHEILENVEKFLNSKDMNITFEFDEYEETMHAVSVIFMVANQCANISIHINGNHIYLKKEPPIKFTEKEMLNAIFNFNK